MSSLVSELWHEHWALDAAGQPPKEFSGYLESMRWKRALHVEHGTTLLETSWAQVVFETGLKDHQVALREYGLEPDWNPERTAPGSKPVKHEDLARLVRSFMSHVKSGSLTREDFQGRLQERTPPAAQGRAQLFLDLYFQIASAWDEKLRADGAVDFEDMLVQAAEHLEAGRVQTGWELVLVDEFQDASRARAG
ncbi:MAG: UvrD-helicase domain-containing protein [Actinomycetota bacterium]|nr:UvrD-helicase domain-containing protein [Actinomycetota bacterium]